MRWFHYVLPFVLLGSSLACNPKNQPEPAPTITREVAPRPTRASAEPFQWALQVHADQVTNYEPHDSNQNIPLPGSDWACVSMALQTHFTDKGSYVESRQVVCKLAGGQMIAGRTACTRDLDGKVDDDIQLITLVDADGEQRGLMVLCGEVDGVVSPQSGTPTREPADDDGPTVVEPKSIYL